MRRMQMLAVVIGCAGIFVSAQTGARADAPATVYDDPATLVRVKGELLAGKGPQDALASLKEEADRALDFEPVSVMQKEEAGPSHDKHDYVSYAPYFWPNPNTASGRPFINKDGYRNSEQIEKGDAPQYKSLLDTLHVLGLAYWYTGNKSYAEKAAKLARVCFINPATRMNPNFQYAQAVLGVNDGRGIGLIENRGFLPALDGLTLISDSGAWTAADQKAMHIWVADFDKWLTTSQNGHDEKATKNNHGSWFAVQESGLYLWLGEPGKARQVFEDAKERIVKQIEPTGREPLEIVRTDGYSYSVFNVFALSTLSSIAERNGVDLWHFESDGHSLKAAIDYLLPFASGKEKWMDNQRARIDAGGYVPIVIAAAAAYHEPKYAAWLKEQNDEAASNWTLLTGIVTNGGEPPHRRNRRDRSADTQPTPSK